MLSRKNYKETIRKQTPTKQHYTIKKLTVGVASVLIGLSFMGELEGDSVHADTMTAGSESTSVTSTTAQDGLKKSPQLYLQVTDTNNPSTPSSASSTGTIKNVTSSAAVQVKSASDEEDSDSTLAKGENKFAQSAVKDSVTDGKTSTAEINPAKLSSPALITQLNQSLAKSSTSDALKANDELEIKATDPTNYPNCGDVDGPLLELDSGQLVNKDEVISLKDMYIFQILKLVNTKDSDFQYVILTMNRKDTADRSIYLFGTGSNYSDATVFKAKPNDTYELGKSGYSFTYTEPTTINGHDVDGSSYVTGSTYYDDWHLKPQHLQIIYSLGNYNPSNTDATSVGEIMPSYEKVPVIKYSGVPSNIISQPKVYIVGFTGQEFNVTDIINNYKKVLKGYYLQNPNVASMGTLSQFENGGYYLKTYYDNGNVDFKGLYHQIDDQGTMEVSVLNANNEIIAGPEIIPAGGSYEFKFYNWFKYYNWIARNPYVTSSAHEVTLKYAKLGSVIPVDENGNKINDGWQYVNDPDDASKATSPYEKAPVIDGYVAVSPDETIVLPHNLSSDTKIYYRKSIKVTYSGSDSKTYDGNPANFDPTTVKWSGLAGLNTSTLTSADFTWNTTDQKAPTAAGKYTLSLNPTGEAALRKANPNYDLKTISGSYTYTITPKMITEAQDVTYDGSYTKTYDGQAASVADIKDPTWTVKGLVNSDKYDHSGLTNEDFNWMKDGQPISGPEAGVGKYVLTLNQHGLDKLNQQNPNYQVDESALSGQYTYTITPLTVVAVNHKGYDKKVYDGRPGVINLDKLVWDELPDGTNLNLSGLTSAYFSWDTPNHEAPTEVGRYTISLTKQGEDLLQSENPNYNFIKFTGTFIYDITPMAEVTVTYNGADGKIYDGQPGTINPAKLTWSKLPDGTSLKMPTWSAGDFAWDTADGLAPTAVGTYQIKLTDAGKAALKKANPNYDLSSITGVFTYEIKPAQTPETPGQTPEQQPGQTPEQQPDQNTNQSGTSENGFGPSARPNASTNSNASQLPQTGNDHSNTALAGLALASLIAMLGLGKKRKHD